MMSRQPARLFRYFLSSLVMALTASHAVAQDAATQAVVEWNAIALRTTKTGAPAIPAMRNLAMTQMAVSDVLNAFVPRYRSYYFKISNPRPTPEVPGIATAAHDVLVALYPKEQERLDQDLANALAQAPDGAAKDRAIEFGKAAAAAVLQARANDRMNDVVPYTAAPEEGIWRPTPGDGIAPTNAPRGPDNVAAMGVSWSKMQPLLMKSPDQFRPGPPPALNSAVYARDFNELIEMGGADSTKRTQDQTDMALFWRPTPDVLYNPLIQTLVVEKKFDAWRAAHVFALANIAMVDAVISSWDAKFVYNQWRPITGIRNASEAVNAKTKAVPGWGPLLFTPPYPDYPGGHPATAGATARVLEYFFGKKPGKFSVTSGGKTRSFESFESVEKEVIDARVWGGVHWRTSDTVAADMGTKIAKYILDKQGK